jgi:hypothetical protein
MKLSQGQFVGGIFVAMLGLGAYLQHNGGTSTSPTTTTSIAQPEPADVEPLSAAKFQSLMQETGCKSVYSDLKKADLAAPYIGKPALVTGPISYISGGKVGITANPDTLTYDVLITFANAQDTFDLQKNQNVTVKFKFKSIGGCFLPFSGDQGQVQ